ncbi:MAG: aromatic ring-hydroxylating dioxygenase subunit alpha [Proteobacteria bacterium]|nr:aromatic ring-hydroxylating dioxygenase subunit alpha [Pseudomonadota bacterium]
MNPVDLSRLVDDRPSEGVFNVHRSAFLDPDLFEPEMRHVFEATWQFVGLESQVAKPNDYFTTTIGRQPVLVSRDAQGTLVCLLNSCRHRGAIVVPYASGNAARHVCRYHGWTYASGGRNTGISNREDGRYPEAFAAQDHDLVPVARFANYRGFLFASLSADVPCIEAHLGESKVFIDLVADQSPQGLEALPGTITYTFEGNWKLQFENGLDFYHFASTHASYVDVSRKRPPAAGPRWSEEESADQGTFMFGRGHAVMWSNRNSLLVQRPISQDAEAFAALKARVGPVRAKWMHINRNLNIFPNMQLIDVSSLQLRVWKPLSVNRTEMTSWCLAPIGEPAAARRLRIRQYEDFFNPTGLATSDDNVIYEWQQAGLAAQAAGPTRGYQRGLGAPRGGGNAHATELGFRPDEWMTGSFGMGSETCFHQGYREWARLLGKVLAP